MSLLFPIQKDKGVKKGLFHQFEYIDNDGWPHYKVINKLPNLKSGEQTLLMKEAVINYFIEKELIQ